MSILKEFLRKRIDRLSLLAHSRTPGLPLWKYNPIHEEIVWDEKERRFFDKKLGRYRWDKIPEIKN
jgi:hypothetical protein